ncbi:MAG: hypothetical protein IPK97_07015 [Ahniella sp.]|nr:hypothetical protein [Ahniella sp.]
MNELEYRRLLKKLPDRIEPQRDLWPDISQKLGPTPARRHHAMLFPFAMAASLLTAMLFGGWLLMRVQPGSAPALAEESERSTVPALWRERQALELESQAAWQQITTTDERSLMVGAGPQVYAAWQELNGAEAELEAALKSAPEAGFLLTRLKHVELEKLKLARLALSA